MAEKRIGIIVGGGPAPGINGVIGAATIEAINHGFDVVGIFDGFKWLTTDRFIESVHAMPLTIKHVARIHFDGGSILRTSRANLIDAESIVHGGRVRNDEIKTRQVIDNLVRLGVDHLITIGGDDTALSARFVSEAADGAIRVVHVPKTIDNDLPLPQGTPTFGFSTARFHGTQVVKNLMQDSITTGRWYLVTVMGRSVGQLAMGIGLAAGATVTVIPEEFHEQTSLHEIADVIEGSMLKRLSMGRPDGVALIAEGLANRLGDKEEIERLLGREVPVDAAGHMRLSDIPLGLLLRREIEARFADRGEKMSIVTHMLGYELRSADPTPGDMAYCRCLGHGCVRLLTRNGTGSREGVLVTLVNGNLHPIKLSEMIDAETNRIRVRRVDINSDIYRVARSYMIRLERADFDNQMTLRRLAEVAKRSPDEFQERYGQTIGVDAAT